MIEFQTLLMQHQNELDENFTRFTGQRKRFTCLEIDYITELVRNVVTFGMARAQELASKLDDLVVGGTDVMACAKEAKKAANGAALS